MNFAENKFLIITAAVALVLCGGLVYYGMSISSQIEEEQVTPRAKLMSDITRYTRRQPANPTTIEQRRKRVDAMTAQREAVAEASIQFNRRPGAYVVPELTLQASGGQEVPALPFAESVWERNGLYLSFVEAFFSHLDRQAAALKPASLPSEKEIAEEAARIQKVLNRQNIRNIGAASPAGAMQNNVRTTGELQISDQALSEAAQTLRLRKAQTGNVYVSTDSFDTLTFVRSVGVTGVPASEIWQAHLSMWLASDITEAIHQTIADVYQRENLPPDQRHVLRSPVKRLVKVQLGEAILEASPTGMSDPYSNMGGRIVDPEMGRGGRPRRSSRPTASRETKLPVAETLTQRVSSPMYNVVNYSVTLHMPQRYLPILQEKLIALNYHTILEQTIEPLPADWQTGGYYYGTEPVQQIVISGELLLLSDWVRGTWQDGERGQEGQWVYPPLMPVSVMEAEFSAAQQRETDKNLIAGELPRPWDPTWTPKPKAAPARGGRR